MRNVPSRLLPFLALLAGCQADQTSAPPLTPVPTTPAAVVSYTPRLLGAVPGKANSVAYGISDSGMTVGFAYADGGPKSAVFWGPSLAPYQLPYFNVPWYMIKSTEGVAKAINTNGMIAGWLNIPLFSNPFQRHAVYWPYYVATPVDIGPYGYNSEANDVNAAGAVVGWMGTSLSSSAAFVWSGSLGRRELPPLFSGAYKSEALAIADDGTIVGWAENVTHCRHAVQWRPSGRNGQTYSTITDLSGIVGLGNCGTSRDVAGNLNSVGWISNNGISNAVRYLGTTPQTLLPTSSTSDAFGISAFNRVVGFWHSGPDSAFTRDPQGLIWTLPLPSGATQVVPFGVNRCGQIVGAHYQAFPGYPLDLTSFTAPRAVLWDGHNGDC